MIRVRLYNKKDFRYIQDICLENSRFANEATATNRAIVCALYCDYYLDCEPQNCFVAVDDNDIPIGYIACSTDLDSLAETMAENYLPLVRKISGSDYYHYSAVAKVERRFMQSGFTTGIQYGISADRFFEENEQPFSEVDGELPDEQKAKLDEQKEAELLNVEEVPTMLIEALIAHLKTLFIEGAYFICDKDDQANINAFRACGFDDIDYISGCVVFGKKFFEED